MCVTVLAVFGVLALFVCCQGPSWSGPNTDKFTYYGYHFEAVCTGEGLLVAVGGGGGEGRSSTLLTLPAFSSRPAFPALLTTHDTCDTCIRVCYPAGAEHVDATSEFGIVVAYDLGGLKVLMAAEIDAQKPGGEPGPEGGLPYVEMKTYRCACVCLACGHMVVVS